MEIVSDIKQIIEKLIHSKRMSSFSFYIGGSHAKGTADKESDYDLGIICDPSEALHCDLRQELPQPLSYIISSDFTPHINVIVNSSKLDIRGISPEKAESLRENLISGKDISNKTQLILWNIANGHYIHGKKPFSINDIKNSVFDAIVFNSINGILLEEIVKSINRNDILLYNHGIGNLHKAAVNIIYAKAKKLFMGYKKIDAIADLHSLDINILNIINNLYGRPHTENIKQIDNIFKAIQKSY